MQFRWLCPGSTAGSGETDYKGYNRQRPQLLCGSWQRIGKTGSFEEITPFLQQAYSADPGLFVALYADETVPYGEIVRILDIANQNQFNMVLMTSPN